MARADIRVKRKDFADGEFVLHRNVLLVHNDHDAVTIQQIGGERTFDRTLWWVEVEAPTIPTINTQEPTP